MTATKSPELLRWGTTDPSPGGGSAIEDSWRQLTEWMVNLPWGLRLALIMGAVILIGLCIVVGDDNRIAFRRQFKDVIFNRTVILTIGVAATILTVQISFTAMSQALVALSVESLDELGPSLRGIAEEALGCFAAFVLALFTGLFGLKTMPIFTAWYSTLWRGFIPDFILPEDTAPWPDGSESQKMAASYRGLSYGALLAKRRALLEKNQRNSGATPALMKENRTRIDVLTVLIKAAREESARDRKYQSSVDQPTAPDLRWRLAELRERHAEVEKRWLDWHTDIGLITSYPAIHLVRTEEFAVRIINADDEAKSLRTKLDEQGITSDLIDSYADAVTEFADALDDGEYRAKLIARGPALDPTMKKIMDTAAHLLQVLERADTDTDDRDRTARKLYQLLEPVVGTAVADAPELEAIARRELEHH